jgi:hypothetical protein
MDYFESKLTALWMRYREACPDPEPSPEFMPELWKRIESRRQATLNVLIRRWVEVCVITALALSLFVTTIAPRWQRLPVYQSTYVDALTAVDFNDEVVVLPGVAVPGEEK